MQRHHSYENEPEDPWAIHNAVKVGDLVSLAHYLKRYAKLQLIEADPSSQPSRSFLHHPDTVHQTYGRTALGIAVMNYNIEMVSLLLKNGCDPNVADKRKQTPLMLALKHHDTKEDHFQLLALLAEHPELDFNKTDEKERSAYLYAVKYGCKRSISLLFPKTKEEKRKDSYGMTGMMVAAARNKVEIIKELTRLNKKASKKESDEGLLEGRLVNEKDLKGMDALMYASLFGNLDAVRILLSLGAKQSSVDSRNRTCLMLAAAKGFDKIVAALVQNMNRRTSRSPKLQANKSTLDKIKEEGGTSPRLESSSFGHLNFPDGSPEVQSSQIIPSSCGNRPKLFSMTSMTSTISVASIPGSLAQSDNVVSFGLRQPDENGSSALILAASNGHLNVVKILSLYATDREIKNAIAVAGRFYNEDIRQYLKGKYGLTKKAGISRLAWLKTSDGRPRSFPQGLASTSNLTEDVAQLSFRAGVTEKFKGGVATASVDKFVDSFLLTSANRSKLKKEMLSLIHGYLIEQGLTKAAEALKEGSKEIQQRAQSLELAATKIQNGIAVGDWKLVRTWLKKEFGKSEDTFRHFLFQVTKQEYLELICNRDVNKALTVLHKRLKPLEGELLAENIDVREEMWQLAYLIVCNSVSEAKLFEHWDLRVSRDNLSQSFSMILKLMNVELKKNFLALEGQDWNEEEEKELATLQDSNRLETLINQAIAYQVEDFLRQRQLLKITQRGARKSKFQGSSFEIFAEKFSLLNENMLKGLPTAPFRTLTGNVSKVKCIEFISGANHNLIVSGARDGMLVLWDLDKASKEVAVIEDSESVDMSPTLGGNLGEISLGSLGSWFGHESTVWDISYSGATSLSEACFVSCSGKGRVCLWKVPKLLAWMDQLHQKQVRQDYINPSPVEKQTADYHEAVRSNTVEDLKLDHIGDIYSIQFSSDEPNMIVTSGYDHTVKLYDIHKKKVIQTMKGHKSAVTHSIFSSNRNLIISGSKDSCVKLWDHRSCGAIRSFSQSFGEITSVDISESAFLLLTSSKDNANRIWDLRTCKVLHKLRGHKNMNRNHIRSIFACAETTVFSGSQDGKLCGWKAKTGEQIVHLPVHSGCLYQAKWNATQGLLATCADDMFVKTWNSGFRT